MISSVLIWGFTSSHTACSLIKHVRQSNLADVKVLLQLQPEVPAILFRDAMPDEILKVDQTSFKETSDSWSTLLTQQTVVILDCYSLSLSSDFENFLKLLTAWMNNSVTFLLCVPMGWELLPEEHPLFLKADSEFKSKAKTAFKNCRSLWELVWANGNAKTVLLSSPPVLQMFQYFVDEGHQFESKKFFGMHFLPNELSKNPGSFIEVDTLAKKICSLLFTTASGKISWLNTLDSDKEFTVVKSNPLLPCDWKALFRYNKNKIQAVNGKEKFFSLKGLIFTPYEVWRFTYFLSILARSADTMFRTNATTSAEF